MLTIKWKKTPRQAVISLGLVLLLFFLDQFTKWQAVRILGDGTAVTLIPGVLELCYVENTGAAFGIFEGRSGWLGILSLAVAVFLCWAYMTRLSASRKALPWNLCCLFLIAGALGNLYDRFLRGFVVDFFSFVLIRFPVFNVADCYVTLAAAAACFLILFGKESD